jgi:hypothetical protein
MYFFSVNFKFAILKLFSPTHINHFLIFYLSFHHDPERFIDLPKMESHDMSSSIQDGRVLLALLHSLHPKVMDDYGW